MKSLMLLTQWLLNEMGNQLGICTARDSDTLESRIEKEGISFLTITLPTYCQGVESALAKGRLVPNDLPGFRFRQGLPVFLQGFLERIFDRGTGECLSTLDVDVLAAVRQLTRLHSKIELRATAARQWKALHSYVQTDQEIVATWDESGSSRLARVAAVLFGELLAPLERSLWEGDYSSFMPKHGPGSTSDRLVGNQKYLECRWPRRLDVVFPAGEFLLVSHRDRDSLSRVRFLDPGEELPVRVTLVPKTLKTPRVIAMEPTAMQYAQQAILGYLTDGILRDKYLRGLIGLNNQVPNQELAKEGSISGLLATLDLSEASDRVSMELVETVFARFPGFLEALKATRSTHASLPPEYNNGITIPLRKFASMGSALCFPVEAMVFLTIIVSVLLERGVFTRLGPKQLSSLLGSVRVFGDDIIVPTRHAVDVIDGLEAFGLKVNRHKSFWTGKFRESCGRDWYDGHDVSYVKTRRPFPNHIRNAEEVISLVSLRNQLYMAGYWETCRRLDQKIVEVLPHFPIVYDTSPVVGRCSVAFEPLAEHICAKHHKALVKGYVIKAPIPINKLDGMPALLKIFLQKGKDGGIPEHLQKRSLEDLFPIPWSDHLERSGRPPSVKLKKARASLA